MSSTVRLAFMSFSFGWYVRSQPPAAPQPRGWGAAGGWLRTYQPKENDMNANRTVDDIVRQAHHTNDPERLREMAAQLTHYGARDAAEKVQHKAVEIERRQADEI